MSGFIPKKKTKSKLLKEYLCFLRKHQCLSEATIFIRKHYVSKFLSEIKDIATPSRLNKLSPETIHDYIIKTCRPFNRASKKHLTSSVRSFLRFAHIYGYLKNNLTEAVPVIVTRKLEGIPRKISWEDVKKLLKCPDRKTPQGRRDYAIILLCATYGVRIGQVRNLKLTDIKWHKGIINFDSSKMGKALSFPLEKRVAQAMLDYIKKDRKNEPFKEVFLTVKEPLRPLGKKNCLHSTFIRYFKQAKIKSKAAGSHLIRHAFATRLMEKKVPIKNISDLLGHKYIETTFIYTKVDIKNLRILARKWPEVQ
jgi:integrase/recombinase XerD